MSEYRGFKIERFEVGMSTKKFNYKCGKFIAPKKMDVIREIDRVLDSLKYIGGYLGADPQIEAPDILSNEDREKVVQAALTAASTVLIHAMNLCDLKIFIGGTIINDITSKEYKLEFKILDK